MKIDLNLPISNPLPPTNRPQRSTRQPEAHNTPVDAANLSSSIAPGKVAQALSSVPEMRMDRVQSLKAAVEQGTYEVSPERIAGAMLSQATSRLR